MDPSYISPGIDGQQGHLNFNVLAVRISGRGEGVKVNPNFVRIVMHIEIYGRSLIYICIHLLDPHWIMPRQSVISTQQHKLSH